MKALYYRMMPDDDWELDGVFSNHERAEVRKDSILAQMLKRGYHGEALLLIATTRDVPDRLPADFSPG